MTFLRRMDGPHRRAVPASPDPRGGGPRLHHRVQGVPGRRGRPDRRRRRPTAPARTAGWPASEPCSRATPAAERPGQASRPGPACAGPRCGPRGTPDPGSSGGRPGGRWRRCAATPAGWAASGCPVSQQPDRPGEQVPARRLTSSGTSPNTVISTSPPGRAQLDQARGLAADPRQARTPGGQVRGPPRRRHPDRLVQPCGLPTRLVVSRSGGTRERSTGSSPGAEGGRPGRGSVRRSSPAR